MLAISFFGIQALLKILYVLRLGYGPQYLGLFNASGAVGYMTMSLPSGALGDRYGSTRVMFCGALVASAGMILLPMTESLPTWLQYAWPILSQMIISGGYAMFSINLVPALMALTSDENRNSAYAFSSALRSLGTFVGTVFGGLLPGIFALLIDQDLNATGPYRLALWFGAAICLTALLPLARIKEAEPVRYDPRTATQGAFPITSVGLLVLYVCFSQAAGATCQSFCSAYMDTELQISPLAIGIIMGAGQFAAIFAPMLGPRLARRHGNGRLLMMVTFGSAASILPLVLIPHWIGAGLGQFGVVALAAVWMPAFQVYQMEVVERRWRSLAYAAVSMAMGLSFALVSFTGGFVVTGWGYPSLFLMGLGLSAIGATMMWGLLKRPAFALATRRAIR